MVLDTSVITKLMWLINLTISTFLAYFIVLSNIIFKCSLNNGYKIYLHYLNKVIYKRE